MWDVAIINFLQDTSHLRIIYHEYRVKTSATFLFFCFVLFLNLVLFSVKHVWRRCNLPCILSNMVALKSYLKSETKIEPDPRLEEA